MERHEIAVNTDLCVGCGLCVQDCASGNLFIGEEGKAGVKRQDCIKCGHCVAICPKAAVSMTGYDEPPVEIERTTTLQPEQLMRVLQAKRSVRKFRAEPVPAEAIRQIIQAGRYTPTAKNLQNVSYVVITEDVARFEKLANQLLKRLLPFAKLFMREARQVHIDEHFFFQGARAAILAVSRGAFGKINGSLAAANMSLMAEACGLSGFYSGFFTIAANRSGRLRRALGLKRGEKVVTTLMLGYPDVRYRRTAQRENAAVRWY